MSIRYANTVSYTHLDVYKRQYYPMPSIFSICISPTALFFRELLFLLIFVQYSNTFLIYFILSKRKMSGRIHSPVGHFIVCIFYILLWYSCMPKCDNSSFFISVSLIPPGCKKITNTLNSTAFMYSSSVKSDVFKSVVSMNSSLFGGQPSHSKSIA